VLAVVVDPAGRPELADVAEPDGPGELVRVLACGLCGSDVEKLRPEFAGAVLGHEVVAETAGGGGWGQPRERDPVALERDVRDGLVTRSGATTYRSGGRRVGRRRKLPEG
jgi:threonine dehydrogenase-like Zn-dependent dehydrogenase